MSVTTARPQTVRAYAVRIDGHEHERIINARSAGKAKYEYLLDLRDVLPDLKITDIRCRSLGHPHSSKDFLRCATYRGLPNARCGDRVRVGDNTGTIVGHNSSANFDVLFDDGQWAGETLNVHPSEIVFQEPKP